MRNTNAAPQRPIDPGGKKPWSEREPQTLEPKQVERVKQSQSYCGHITLSVCDNCEDNTGPLTETDVVRFFPPQIRKEWWCMDCREREFGLYTNYENQDEPVHLVAFPGGW